MPGSCEEQGGGHRILILGDDLLFYSNVEKDPPSTHPPTPSARTTCTCAEMVEERAREIGREKKRKRVEREREIKRWRGKRAGER